VAVTGNERLVRVFVELADTLVEGFDPVGFLTSPVALTLYGMGVVLIPAMLWLQAGWWTGDGLGRARATGRLLTVIFTLGLGTAVLAAVALTMLGTATGSLVCALLLVTVFHPRGLGGVLARGFPMTTVTHGETQPSAA